MSLHTFLSNPIPVGREIAKILARFVRSNDEACFNELWELHRKIPETTAFQDAEKTAVANEFTNLASAVNNRTTATVKRLPVSGKYVIFSDHHITPAGHRHDYFRTFGNYKLYSFVLLQYFLKGYTVIENGDIEDLLMFDPTVRPTLSQAQEWGKLNVDGKFAELETKRHNFRLDQLNRILSSYDADKYKPIRLLADSFFRNGRYFRTVGNHDDDMMTSDFDRVMEDWLNKGHSTHLPFQQYRTVVLEDANGAAKYVITHGNQFDRSTTPTIAAKSGELHSECLSWAYEGADRTWRWSTHNIGWAEQQKTFRNRLVTDEPRSISDEVKRVLSNPLLVLNGDPTRLLNLLEGMSNEGIYTLIEAIFDYPVAWEYIAGSTAIEKMRTIITKKEFFKFRHTNEVNIVKQWKSKFTGTPPTLVLGHTHEVRFNPVGADGAVPYYMNTGSAGRFENLIWGLEVENGAARLISWHYEGGPAGEKTIRHIYRNSGDQLAPSSTHQPL